MTFNNSQAKTITEDEMQIFLIYTFHWMMDHITFIRSRLLPPKDISDMI